MKKLCVFLLLFSGNLFAQELTLYFSPSPKGIDWSTPTKLVRSGLENKLTFKKRFIGHVFIDLHCGQKKELTGMTADRFDYVGQLLLKGRGLGILYHSFEGKLEDEKETRPELDEYIKTGAVNFVRFKLSENQCKRATQYLSEYRSKGVYKNYGLANRPRLGEGAGCSAYGVSFLDVLGILDQDMKESWGQSINIPHAYAGAPLTEQWINLFTFFTQDVQWAKENEKHTKLFFWSPDRMFSWVKKKTSKKEAGYEILTEGKAQGVAIDKSYFPTPEEPIWRQRLDPNNKKETY